jgi:hypothetical protein
VYQNPVLFPQLTNRESWTLPVQINDEDTDDPIALADDEGNPLVSIQFEVRRTGHHHVSSGYGSSFYDWGVGNEGPALKASIGNGITLLDTGVFQVYFSETQMRCLRRGTYEVGCTLASLDGVDVRQLFRGRLPILDGLVTT